MGILSFLRDGLKHKLIHSSQKLSLLFYTANIIWSHHSPLPPHRPHQSPQLNYVCSHVINSGNRCWQQPDIDLSFELWFSLILLILILWSLLNVLFIKAHRQYEFWGNNTYLKSQDIIAILQWPILPHVTISLSVYYETHCYFAHTSFIDIFIYNQWIHMYLLYCIKYCEKSSLIY